MHLGCKTFKNTLKTLSQKSGGFFPKVIKQVYRTPMSRNLLGIHRSLLPYPRLPALGAVRRQRWSLRRQSASQEAPARSRQMVANKETITAS